MDLSTDLAGLDFGNLGAWPPAVKALCHAVVAAVVLGAGYVVFLADERGELAAAEQQEWSLKDEFDAKRTVAAGLAAHRAMHDQTAEAFAALLRGLPADTEVPGLIEDISRAAIANDLAIDRIDLADERPLHFLLELPIAIGVNGDYRDLAAFVGAVGTLPRLVTLHDFDIAPQTGPGNLKVSVEARTYRYAGGADESALAEDGP